MEVLKEMRDLIPSVSAVVLLLLNVAKDQAEGAPPLSAIIHGREDEFILRYVSPLVDAKHPLLFRHTRDLLWHLALYEKTKAGASRVPAPYHYGWNLLDETYFGKSGNDYHVRFGFLDRQRHQRMESLKEAVDQDGLEAPDAGEESDEDDSDGLESDAEEDEEDSDERRSIERSEAEADPSLAAESFDSDASSDDSDEASKSPDKARAPHGWMEVRLPDQAVQAGQQLRSEDVDEEEKEDADGDTPHDTSTDTRPDAQPSLQRRPSQALVSPPAAFDVAAFMPERWDRRSAEAQATLAKHQREVEAAKTNSVRLFINKDGDPEPFPSPSPSTSPASSPSGPSPSTPFTALQSPAPDLLHSSLFSRARQSPPPAPPAVYPEPLHVVAPSDVPARPECVLPPGAGERVHAACGLRPQCARRAAVR